jgi:hypothetical protein
MASVSEDLAGGKAARWVKLLKVPGPGRPGAMVVSDRGEETRLLFWPLPVHRSHGLAFQLIEQDLVPGDYPGDYELTDVAAYKAVLGGPWPTCECRAGGDCVHLLALSALLEAGLLPAGGGE